MARRFARWIGLLLPAVIALGCGGPAPQPLVLGAAPWQSGEVARYRLYDGDAESGSALLAIDAADSAASDGAATWGFRRETSGPGGLEVVEVALDRATLRPLRSVFTVTDAGGVEQVNATWNRGQIDLELISKQQNTTVERMSVPSDTYDQRTLPSIVRALPLAQGYATQINTFLPYTGRLDRYTVRVRGREQIDAPAGSFDTWEVALDNGDRTVRYWVSVEAPYPVVQMQDANIRFALEIFTPGAE